MKKLRRYPPLIVSAVVALALMGAAVRPIGNAVAGLADGQPTVPPATASPVETQFPEVRLAELLAAAAKTAPTPEPTPTATPEPAPEPTYQSAVWSRDFDGEEAEMLMKIAMAEAEGESTEGKALVMMVVLNRVWSDSFPGTIEEVIFQKNQFSPVREGGRYYTTEPNEDCAKALEMVLDGWDESQGALYFEAKGNDDSWHSKNLEFLFQYGGHKFYR